MTIVTTPYHFYSTAPHPKKVLYDDSYPWPKILLPDRHYPWLDEIFEIFWVQFFSRNTIYFCVFLLVMHIPSNFRTICELSKNRKNSKIFGSTNYRPGPGIRPRFRNFPFWPGPIKPFPASGWPLFPFENNGWVVGTGWPLKELNGPLKELDGP